jgi:hypothetical protein
VMKPITSSFNTTCLLLHLTLLSPISPSLTLMSSAHLQSPSSGPMIPVTSLCYHNGGTRWREMARKWRMDQLHCAQLVLRLWHERHTAASAVSTTTCARASTPPNSASETPCLSTVTPLGPLSTTTPKLPVPSTSTSNPSSASPLLLISARCQSWSDLVALVSRLHSPVQDTIMTTICTLLSRTQS